MDDLLPELHSVSDRFDEWLVWRREGLHIRAMATLDQLTTRALDQQQFAEAAVYARRQLTFEPWLEPAHRQLMLALAHKGDRHEALAQFEQCVQLLQRELGVTPDQATVTLATQIRAGTFATAPQAALPTHAPQPTTAPPATPPEPTLPQPAKIDWGEAPEITALHGREAEMQLLTRWLVTDQCRLVAVVGMGGMGKTTLAASTVHQVAEHFDVVIWRSLLNAPQPEEMIRSWLRLLDEAQTTQAAQDFDTALAQLFTQLQGRRCLLILDNVESLLQSDDRAGHYRSGYAAYGQLFKRFGETSHRSTLFLTSREAPQEVVRLARERPTVQSLALVGLSVPAGQAILRRQGITVRDGSVELLVARYSGNPLALMLVGETIQELFAGDVAAFLEQPLIFDDIRDVLDQQWTRLSALERTLLLWLAIEREPLTPTQLSANLYPAVPLPTLIEALNSLRRRSLLERQGEEHRFRSAVGGQGFCCKMW
ncbi:MAG: BTAD domain-containing putative transcriptional regulator [Caldilineaceae bacterium]